MKKYFLLSCISAAFLMSCGNGEDPLSTDSVKKDAAVAETDPEKPHEVKAGKGGDYAFKPDSCVQSIVLGDPNCLGKYFRENGSNKMSISGSRYAASYYNSSTGKKQLMELYITENAGGQNVVYGITVQRQEDDDEHAPELLSRAIPSSDFNFVSGHGIYIGMPLDHVMSIYKNQTFMQWEKGDTVYLQYKPKPKDANFFKRYKPDAYSVTYKFKDETLRRMEYAVDPKQFEN